MKTTRHEERKATDRLYRAITSRRPPATKAAVAVLKQRKFDGDFNAMLAWWREHKNAEHLALAQAGGTSIPRRAPTTPQ